MSDSKDDPFGIKEFGQGLSAAMSTAGEQLRAALFGLVATDLPPVETDTPTSAPNPNPNPPYVVHQCRATEQIDRLRSALDRQYPNVHTLFNPQMRALLILRDARKTEAARAQEVLELRGTIQERDRLVETLKRDLGAANSSLRKQTDREVEDLDSENRFHMVQIENLAKTLAARDAQIEGLRGQVKELESASANPRLNEWVGDVSAECKRLQEENQRLIVQIESWDHRNSENEKMLESQATIIDNARRQQKELDSELTELRRQLAIERKVAREGHQQRALVNLLSKALGDIGTVVTEAAHQLP